VRNPNDPHSPNGSPPLGLPPPSLFIVESHPKTQENLLEKFRDCGFSVEVSDDAQLALKRFQEQPYRALIVDAGAAGEASVHTFRKIIEAADTLQLALAAVLILNEDQSDWAALVPPHSGASVMIRPVNLKQLSDTLKELLAAE
jgi:DNA-binding response OmpR family regulator